MTSGIHIWRVFQIIPMRSKLEAGTTLYRINRDVRVENEIFMDNTPNKTGYSTEMQIVERLAITDGPTTKPHSPWKNKAESVINIIKGKSKIRRAQRNTPKRVWDIGMI